MNFIIIGDKFQKRMKSKGCVALIKKHNRTNIEHQYKVINDLFPKAKIIYIHGFESKKFLSFLDKHNHLKDNIVALHNPLYDKYNNSYSLFLAKEYLKNDSIILFGDHIPNKKIFNKFSNKHSQVFVNNKNKSRLGCVIHNDKIENISYDLDNYLLEVYFLSKQHYNTTRSILDNPKNYNCFIFEIFNKLIDANEKIIPRFVECSTTTTHR